MKANFLILLVLLFCPSIHAQQLELVMPRGHTQNIYTITYSPDGKTILSSSDDNTLKIWDAASGRLLHSIDVPTPITIIRYSPDGKRFLTHNDMGLTIWDATTVLPQFQLRKGFYDLTAVFSPDSKYILTAGNSDDSVRLWSVEDPRRYTCLTGRCSQAWYSPTGKRIVTISSAKATVLTIWDAVSHKPLWQRKVCSGSTLVTLSPDEKKLVFSNECSGELDRAYILDAGTGAVTDTLKCGCWGFGQTLISPDSKHLLASSGAKLNVWNLGKVSDTPTTILSGLLFDEYRYSPDGSMVFASASYEDSDGIEVDYAPVFDVSTGKVLYTLPDIESNSDICFSPDGKNFAMASADFSIEIRSTTDGKLIQRFAGLAANLSLAHVSNDSRRMLSVSDDHYLRLWDMSAGSLLHAFHAHDTVITAASFSPDAKRIVTASDDNTAKVWDAVADTLIRVLKGHTDIVNAASFSPDGKNVLTASNDMTARIWDPSGQQSPIVMSNPQGFVMLTAEYSSDGRKIVTAANMLGVHASMYMGPVYLWSARTGQLLDSIHDYDDGGFPAQACFLGNDTGSIVAKGMITPHLIFYPGTQKAPSSLPGTDNAGIHLFSPDRGKYFATRYNNDTLYASVHDSKTFAIDTVIINDSMPVSDQVLDVDWKHNYIISAENANLYVSDLRTGKRLLTLVAFDSVDWVVLHPSGLFDASPGAMNKMYWTRGLDIIDFSQIKDRYWEPGLWSEVVSGKKLRDVRGMDEIKLQPAVSLGPVSDGVLPITLAKRDGGYGKVAVSINGKEMADTVITAANGFDTSKPSLAMNILIQNNPLLIHGKPNLISVRAWSADGFVEGTADTILYTPPGETSTALPKFFAVVCGVSQYADSSIDLHFAHTDAKAIAKAVTLGANRLFGADRTFVYTLTSPGDVNNPPDKAHIRQIFDDIKKKAGPNDILLLYLSGHGTTYTAAGGIEDFYYLTSAVHNANGLDDPTILKNETISATEFTSWINEIPALKQVMIMDACHSGVAVDKMVAGRGIDPSQVKAIDRMKDRTGMFIISGCAADAESYEASQFGQGLLTYSILLAMQGAQLRDDQYVDVSTVLNFARDKVPQLAAGVGGIQVPEMLTPPSGSFDIGMLRITDRDSIPVAKTKPVFVSCDFINSNTIEDNLNVSLTVDSMLEAISDLGEGIIFVNAKQFPQAYTVSGIYTQNKNAWTMHYKIKNATQTIGPKDYKSKSPDTRTFGLGFMRQLRSDIEQIHAGFAK